VGRVPRRPRPATGAAPRPLSGVTPTDGSPVVVLGTGALACAIGGRLARAGHPVVLVGAWRAAREAMAQRGVVVHEPAGTWSAPIETASADDAPEGCATALVLVKAAGTARAARTLARVLAPGGVAVTLQNGLGPRETLAAALGRDRVASGVALMGALLVAPGEVSVVPGRVVLGEAEATRDGVLRLADRLRAAGQEVETSPDLDRVLWTKLAANCAINALSALTGKTNGELLEDAATLGTLREAAREAGAVASARGVPLAADAATIAEEVARATAANHSSMRQDLDRGTPTEVDFLNGAVVEAGRSLSIPTPVNEGLWRAVREREGRPVPGDRRQAG
jgi:2-dehydropantoate 2-reductase